MTTARLCSERSDVKQPSSVDDLQISLMRYLATIRPLRFSPYVVRAIPQHLLGSLSGTAECGRGPEDVPSSEWTYELVMSDSRKSHRGNAATLRAIGVTSKLAGFNPRLEVCRERPRGLSEDAPIG